MGTAACGCPAEQISALNPPIIYELNIQAKIPMLLLVTDTSGKHGSVALARAAEGAKPNQIHVIEEVPLAGGTFSAQLVPQIAELLAKHRFNKTDIGAFIVVSGPGSFTGLRVGLAAIKALAEILHKPIVPVSLLEVVAVAGAASGRVLAALDAGRNEVYVGEYELSAGNARLLNEQLLPVDEFFATARSATVLTLDEHLVAKAVGANLSLTRIEVPGAARVALVGWQKLQAGVSFTPDQLDANYIRRSDAEIFSKVKS